MQRESKAFSTVFFTLESADFFSCQRDCADLYIRGRLCVCVFCAWVAGGDVQFGTNPGLDSSPCLPRWSWSNLVSCPWARLLYICIVFPAQLPARTLLRPRLWLTHTYTLESAVIWDLEVQSQEIHTRWQYRARNLVYFSARVQLTRRGLHFNSMLF